MSGLFQGKQIADRSVDLIKINEDLFLELPIASSDQMLTNDAAGLKSNLSLEREGSYAVLYGKNDSDGNPIEIGRINVSIGAIQDAYYDSTTNEIVIEIITSDGVDELRIPAQDLIDIYTSSGYIDLDVDNNFTLNYNLLKDDLINDGFLTGNASDLDEFAKVNDDREWNNTQQIVSSNNIIGERLSSNSWIATDTKTDAIDGKSGVFLNQNGVFVSRNPIDGIPKGIRWSFDSNTATYYSRILEIEQGKLCVTVNNFLIGTEDVNLNTKNAKLFVNSGLQNTGALWNESSIYTGKKGSALDGIIGNYIGADGTMLLQASSSPRIQFVTGTGTTITSQLAETVSGQLHTSGRLVVGSLSSTINPNNRTLLVNGTTQLTAQLYGTAIVVGTNGNKVNATDGISGVVLEGADGSVELVGPRPYIDFHFNNSTSDYTTKLIEAASGQLNTNGKLVVGSLSEIPASNINLYVNGNTSNGILFNRGSAFIGTNKAAYNDGNNGWYLGVDGTAHLTGTTPAISFWSSGASSFNTSISNYAQESLRIIAKNALIHQSSIVPTNAAADCFISLNRNERNILTGSTSSAITTAQFLNWLNNNVNVRSNQIYFKCSWYYAGNDYISVSETGLGIPIPLAGATIEIFKADSGDTISGANTSGFTIRVTTPTTQNIGSPTSAGQTFIYNHQGVGYSPGWRWLPNHTVLPVFGNVNTISITSALAFDLRYDLQTILTSSGTYNITSLNINSGNVVIDTNGREWMHTVINSSGGNVTINYNINSASYKFADGIKSITIPGGGVCEIGYKRVNGLWLVRIGGTLTS